MEKTVNFVTRGKIISQVFPSGIESEEGVLPQRIYFDVAMSAEIAISLH